MPTGDSKAIITNQPGIHEKLNEVVEKHLSHPFKKPYQMHTEQAFNEVNQAVQAFLSENPQGEIILDACCGVGQSTRILAKKNPQALVIGVDKSAHRINRNVEGFEELEEQGNFHLVRADLNDFYRLVKAANWPVTKHYILYPNPWPKAKHLQRRWHGSAVFPQMTSIGQQLILRSNWRLYLEEFQQAAGLVNLRGNIEALPVDVKNALTPFEAKYQASQQVCYQLSLVR
ncbi:tRNA (guanine(46)-N(7))-methyltransferase TrmB [Colwellia asteriadis]